MSNEILLIAENIDNWRTFSEQLLLLRASDRVAFSDFDMALPSAAEKNPSVIFLCASPQSGAENIVQGLQKVAPNAFTILVIENFDMNFIPAMYDLGIDDYILKNSTSAEILVKTVIGINRFSERILASHNVKLLENIGAISPISGFYTEKFAQTVMESELSEEIRSVSVLMILTYDELDKASFDFATLSSAVRKSVRLRDTVIELNSGKFYILLKDCGIEGATVVFNKIKTEIGSRFRLKAGICLAAGMSFKLLEQKTSSALTDAMLSTREFSVYQERELNDAEDNFFEAEPKQKDYKLFKQMFVNKLEKVVTPVFYNFQNANDGMIDDTKIEQCTDESRCVFNLSSFCQTSRLTIIYTGMAKVVIYITHSGLDSPENKELTVPLKDLTISFLTKVMEEFIREYKSCMEKEIL